MIVEGDEVARFVSEAIGFGLCPPFVAIGIKRDGAIVAGVILNCFEGHDVHVTAAGHGWTRGYLRALGEYIFDGLGCLRATITTEQDHVAVLANKLGAQEEGRLRDHFGKDRDGIVMGVLKDEYRFRARPFP